MTPAYRIAGSAVAKQSNGLVQQKVHSDPNAIGFVSFDFTGGTHTVPTTASRARFVTRKADSTAASVTSG